MPEIWFLCVPAAYSHSRAENGNRLIHVFIFSINLAKEALNLHPLASVRHIVHAYGELQ